MKLIISLAFLVIISFGCSHIYLRRKNRKMAFSLTKMIGQKDLVKGVKVYDNTEYYYYLLSEVRDRKEACVIMKCNDGKEAVRCEKLLDKIVSEMPYMVINKWKKIEKDELKEYGGYIPYDKVVSFSYYKSR